jgi:hypothetical protein
MDEIKIVFEKPLEEAEYGYNTSLFKKNNSLNLKPPNRRSSMIMMKPINIDEWEIEQINEKNLNHSKFKTKHHGT